MEQFGFSPDFPVDLLVCSGQDMPWSSSETTALVTKEGEDDLEECVKVGCQ